MKSCKSLVIGLVIAALAACGGGSGDMVARIGGGGSGAPPVNVGVGTVGGFGSIVIGGARYDDTGAQFSVDEKPDAATVTTVDAVRLGMQMQYEHADGRIRSATVGAEVIGPVSSVAASALTVLGQTVRVNADPAAPTVFDGFGALAELTAGAVVEVHGVRNAASEIVATRIALRPAAGVLRVAGTVSDLTATTFRIGTLTVRSAGAALVPANQALAAGARVAVWSDQPLVNGELPARVIRVGGFALPATATLALEGVVTDLQSAASWKLAGVSVDATGATYVGGGAADLRNGRAVRASGVYSGAVLRAARVEFLAAAAVELTGSVSSFVGTASPFTIRNTAVRVGPQTAYTGGDAGNLGDGVLVKATGALVNGVVEAARIEFLPPSAGIARVLFGTVSAPLVANGALRTFRLAPLPLDVATTASTTFRKGTLADLALGRNVKVQGSYDGTRFTADEIQFMDNANDPPTVELAGIASNVQPGAVTVNGSTVTLTGATVYRKGGAAATFADLKNGLAVEIEAVRLNGQLFASVVEINAPASGSASVRGTVSGRATPATTEFLVGSQRVSVAANPQVIPGNKSVADIRNGNEIEVTGTLAGGLLTANRVKFR